MSEDLFWTLVNGLMVEIRKLCDLLNQKLASFQERMVPPCSREEKHKRLSSQLLVQGKTNKSSTPWKGSTVKISCFTITFHHTLLEKLVAWAARGGEKLVTES